MRKSVILIKQAHLLLSYLDLSPYLEPKELFLKINSNFYQIEIVIHPFIFIYTLVDETILQIIIEFIR